ncbi:MAG: molybdate ABC transporter substrate-binding protein [Anaerolineaceae bacterium]|nr:molybdate ABC transporter substrate-binding protein [Anaerolineaceae bacterium]
MKQNLLALSLLLTLVWHFPVVQGQAEGELVVFAAASLTDAYEAIATAFEEVHPGVNILFNFGGSSTLATQLIQGAPADVFASANTQQMVVAIEGGRIAGTPRTFAKNRLVVIVPADNPAPIQSLHDLANPGVHLILAAPEVPVRTYTDIMLDRMALDPAYGDDYRGAVLGNIVSEEPNVRQVSAKIALGEADAGIVYRSDITPDIANQVIMLPIPDPFNTIATYPIALTNDTAYPELAAQFVDFVLSDAGQDILVAWGLISVRIPPLPDTVTLPNDGTLRVDGQVLNPLSLTANSLRADYATQTVVAAFTGTPFTGVLLWDVITAAQPNLNADVPDDQLSLFIVVTGADGAQVTFSWGEIDPAYGGQPVIVAYTENGNAITDAQGGMRLVVPNDRQAGRSLRGIVNISLRDAPPPAGD